MARLGLRTDGGRNFAGVGSVFDPLNRLERLLVAAATDPSQRADFARSVLKAEVAVAMTSRDADAQPCGVPLQGGGVAAAVFTAPQRVAQVFGAEAGVVVGPGRQVLDWLRPGPIALNPGLDHTVVWSPADLERLLDEVSTEVISKNTKVMLGRPGERPNALIERLEKAFTGSSVVTEAYLSLAHREDLPKPGLMLGVSGKPWDAVITLINQALEGYEFGDEALDLVEIEDGPFGDALRQGIPIKSPN